MPGRPDCVKRIVFDFAGVLFHWQPHELVQRCLPARACDEAAARHWQDQIFQGYVGDWGEFDRGTVSAATLVRRIARRTGLSEHEVQAVVDAVPAELQPMPHSVALLQRLRDAGHALYFLSNMPEPYAAHLEREHAFVGWFNAGMFSSRVHCNKPEPRIFELAAQRFQAEPSSLVFIDDVPANVQAARDAGWNALHFQDAADCERLLRAHGWAFEPP
jgi:putative hydrolase of the HAD superfamily